MLKATDRIYARELVHDIIPKLKALEKLVNDTLQDMVAKGSSHDERSRHQLLKQEFELEILMIQMNLDHLLTRYAQEVQALSGNGDSNHADAILELDPHERVAIDSARKLYKRAHAIQTGRD